jgi:protease I
MTIPHDWNSRDEKLLRDEGNVWFRRIFDYDLTYPEITVEEEFRAALSDPNNFPSGHFSLLRDDPEHLKRGFAVRERNYLSARYPGDIYTFSLEFLKMLDELD